MKGTLRGIVFVEDNHPPISKDCFKGELTKEMYEDAKKGLKVKTRSVGLARS